MQSNVVLLERRSQFALSLMAARVDEPHVLPPPLLLLLLLLLPPLPVFVAVPLAAMVVTRCW